MNFNDRAILVGMALGDANISSRVRYNPDKNGEKKYQYTTSAILIAHSKKQIEYLRYKADILQSIFGGSKPNIVEYETFLPATGKSYSQCRFQKTNTYFRLLHPLIYCNAGKKFYTRKLLDLLTPQGIAFWYMDDGHARFGRRKDGTVKSCNTEIGTYCSEQEADTIVAYFDEVWNIKFRKAQDSRLHVNHQWFIRCNTSETKKFVSLVRKFIHSSMSYKIDHLPCLEEHECQTPAVQGEDIV